jgi:lysozyme family protein
MAEESFDCSMAFVLKAEGGYVDNPADPGGATNMGITLRALSDWRGTAVTKNDVLHLSTDEAEAILGARYWNSTHCGQMPPGVDLMLFDCAVNTGVSRAAKMLQAIAAVDQDGSIGPITLADVAKFPALDTIERMANLRATFYRSLPTFKTFGHGWLNRVASVQAIASILATSPPTK